jgi:YidC/Oxa1 family membrane protein insertase
MNGFLDTVLFPLEWFVATIMVGFHTVLESIGLPPASGWTWALSIVGLVVVLRILLIPLFVKQIHASRKMQLIQPEMQKIQKKYKGKSDPDSRQAMTQETMDLYKRTGTNPFSSCLPILLQSPFFFALFRVLNSLPAISDGTKNPIGPLTRPLAAQAEQSTLLGAQLSSSFMGSSDVTVKIVTVVLIVLMSATTFTTQRQLMMKNMPATALDNPFAKQQKMLLYLMPLFFAISGINFPIGVLLYWLTTNLWSMGQQFYVIRRMPAPGSLAEKALEERRMKSGKAHKKFTLPGLHHEEPADEVQDTVEEPVKPVSGQRQQPKRKKRNRPVPPNGTNGTNGTKPATKPVGKPGAPAAAKPAAPASAKRSATGGDTPAARRDA